jgi:carbamoyltransferase
VSPLDTDAAAALGASLSVDPPTGLLVSTLAFAAGYTADEVKRSLDRCRIDYVYEPSWERLLARVGRMLARGKQVAWCQGRADIGRVSLGSRSILTDPSNRYARDNVNGYLLRRPLDAPLTVAMTEEVANEAVTDVVAGMAERFVTIASSWRARAAGVIDERGQNAVHVVTRSSAPELSDLLTHCRREHDMIGLVNVSLRCANGALAVSPVDAITAFFAAPIDALVVDRFLVMKDYWLLRSDSP